MQTKLLIVDDELSARYALRRAFEGGYHVLEAGTVAEARERLDQDCPEVVLLDYSLPGEDGLSLLRDTAGVPEAPAIIMITAHGSERVAVEAMKAGAYDYLAKPYDLDELRLLVERAVERQQLRSEVRDLRERLAAEGRFGRMIGASAVMRELFITADRVAHADLPVLLLGESGTGKDLLAQEIHARSSRVHQRLVVLNCAALPETLVESELFGYERGAFTGATAARAGKFELAHGGTLFLDEIGDMAPATQAKILRVAESGTVERLGGGTVRQVNVRILAATNQDLPAAIREGRFRQDLYFRLAGVTLCLPPLRQRRDDVPLLIERFWEELRGKYKRKGPELTSDAILRLGEAPWPGNVRQLRNNVEKIFVLARGETVTRQDIEAAIEPEAEGSRCPKDILETKDYREARRRFEVAYLTCKLQEHGGNVTRTAATIGLERQSLQEKIRQLGISRT
ncbi:MAG: sigma-54 dependent transcriptional regulator [Acidobacteriia bacterium]|nr:sigma-54 dependent transcriptional regulator [Terriglobia bacterium]